MLVWSARRLALRHIRNTVPSVNRAGFFGGSNSREFGATMSKIMNQSAPEVRERAVRIRVVPI
jgi:hypothetical protein